MNLSDFFFNGDIADGIPNGTIVEVSFQSPFGSGDAVDFALQKISAINGSSIILGDVDTNGVVNFFDIAPLIDLLTSGEFKAEADIDLSGSVNFLDIQPFIDILSEQ